jgi:hypothetical protein
VGKVDQARFLDGAQKVANVSRVVVCKRWRELGQAECGEGARE